ncbi:unnamed protein product [Moneuplotes crassus]|uniref:Uncharacterized protein n=1 Tax=Euplotes crassus TaxID=5936 RepID=A0AAD1UDM4_EUPCR|nr:unnamed protein product [Moneuplotes crassus]
MCMLDLIKLWIKEKTSPQKKSIRTEMKHQKSLQYHVVYKKEKKKMVFPNLISCFINKNNKRLNKSRKSKQTFCSSFGKSHVKAQDEQKSYQKSLKSKISFNNISLAGVFQKSTFFRENKEKHKRSDGLRLSERKSSQPVMKIPKRSEKEECITLRKVPETTVYLKNFVTLNKKIAEQMKKPKKLSSENLRDKLWNPDIVQNISQKYINDKSRDKFYKTLTTQSSHLRKDICTSTKKHLLALEKKRLKKIMNIPISFC